MAAWLTIAVQMGFVAGALASSLLNLSDIISPKHVIFGGATGAALVNFLLYSASGFSEGIVLRFLTGFFLAGVYPPAFKLIATWFRGSRGLALGILAGAIVVGNGMPHLISGLGGLDWQVVIVSTSVLTFTGGLITEFAIKEGPFPFPKAKFDPHEAGRVFKNRGVRLASLGYVGHMWELFGMYAWISIFFAFVLGSQKVQSESAGAYSTFAVFVAGGFGCWLGGILADRWGRTQTTSLMMIISGTCALIIGLIYSFPAWLVILLSLVWGFTVVADSAQFSTMVTELADQSYVGTALTLQLAAGFTITGVIIWLIPYFVDLVGWRWAFSLLALGPLLGVTAMRRLRNLQEATRISEGVKQAEVQ